MTYITPRLYRTFHHYFLRAPHRFMSINPQTFSIHRPHTPYGLVALLWSLIAIYLMSLAYSFFYALFISFLYYHNFYSAPLSLEGVGETCLGLALERGFSGKQLVERFAYVGLWERAVGCYGAIDGVRFRQLGDIPALLIGLIFVPFIWFSWLDRVVYWILLIDGAHLLWDLLFVPLTNFVVSAWNKSREVIFSQLSHFLDFAWSRNGAVVFAPLFRFFALAWSYTGAMMLSYYATGLLKIQTRYFEAVETAFKVLKNVNILTWALALGILVIFLFTPLYILRMRFSGWLNFFLSQLKLQRLYQNASIYFSYYVLRPISRWLSFLLSELGLKSQYQNFWFDVKSRGLRGVYNISHWLGFLFSRLGLRSWFQDVWLHVYYYMPQGFSRWLSSLLSKLTSQSLYQDIGFYTGFYIYYTFQGVSQWLSFFHSKLTLQSLYQDAWFYLKYYIFQGPLLVLFIFHGRWEQPVISFLENCTWMVAGLWKDIWPVFKNYVIHAPIDLLYLNASIWHSGVFPLLNYVGRCIATFVEILSWGSRVFFLQWPVDFGIFVWIFLNVKLFTPVKALVLRGSEAFHELWQQLLA